MHCSLIKIKLTGCTTLLRIDNIFCAFKLNISSETVWHHLTPTTFPLYPLVPLPLHLHTIWVAPTVHIRQSFTPPHVALPSVYQVMLRKETVWGYASQRNGMGCTYCKELANVHLHTIWELRQSFTPPHVALPSVYQVYQMSETVWGATQMVWRCKDVCAQSFFMSNQE